MNPQAYSFNSEARYPAGPAFKVSATGVTPTKFTNPRIQVQEANTDGEALDRSFVAAYPNFLEKYVLPPVRSEKVIQAWKAHPMQFWQNQLNFALWCATAGSGVSVQDHVLGPNSLMASLYTFHVYYQSRRILAEMQVPLPQDAPWDAFNNPYDRKAYERICAEFGVSPHVDWRIKLPNHGLGTSRQAAHGVSIGDNHLGTYTPGFHGFSWSGDVQVKIDHIGQEGADDLWKTLLLDKSFGFTQPGVERLNDSIRTYVWAILGAQAQTRTRILGTGMAFDAQKQFLANVEDATDSPVDLPAAIKRYQDMLQYAGSAVDFVFGIGLYMAPSDMLLLVGKVAGYNNQITVATTTQTLGLNSEINLPEAPPDADNHTQEAGLVKPIAQRVKPSPQPVRSVNTAQPSTASHHNDEASHHNDEKTALIIGGMAVGLAALWLLR